MTEPAEEYGDALTRPFWEAARRHELVLQRCSDCGAHQFYPRPFCISCQSDRVEWVQAAGTGIVYSLTTVRLQISPDLTPPYVVVLVDLDEGPRLLGTLDAESGSIGQRVAVSWRKRDPAPPLPIFRPIEKE